MFLCLNYKHRNKKYLILDKKNSSRCSKYVLQGASCNVEGILISKQHVLKAKEACIKAKKETAFQLVYKNMSCIKHLEKQQEFLKSKGKDIVCYSLKTLNKLEKVKERERQIKLKYTAVKAIAT